jgi:hypothetical protein
MGTAQTFPLVFSQQEKDAKADRFSYAVYAVLDAMSTIPPDPNSRDSVLVQVMGNALGGNLGKVPAIGNTPDGKIGNSVISNEIRTHIKSIMRGVYDFNEVKEFQPDGVTRNWYPDPATNTGNAGFNAYNLNPFVWFVHVKLGLSGYGFSLDDDVADVGAEFSTHLKVAIGGLNGLNQAAEWTWGAPYGPVSGTGRIVKVIENNQEEYRIVDLPPDVVAQLHGLDPDVGPGARVTGPGIDPTRRLTIKILRGGTAVALDGPATEGATGTYRFAGPKDVLP